jgi:hypothetical protein
MTPISRCELSVACNLVHVMHTKVISRIRLFRTSPKNPHFPMIFHYCLVYSMMAILMDGLVAHALSLDLYHPS